MCRSLGDGARHCSGQASGTAQRLAHGARAQASAHASVLEGPAGAFAQEDTVMRNTLSDNKLYGYEKASQYCISDLTVLGTGSV